MHTGNRDSQARGGRTQRLMRRALRWSLATALVTSALPASALSLMEAYEAARGYDPVYRAAWQERTAGVQEERMARARLLPQASLSYGYYRNWLVQHTEHPTLGDQRNSNSNYPSFNGRFEMRQSLFDMQAWANWRQGQALSRQADAQFDGQGQELILRVFESYATALLARDQYALAKAQVASLGEQAKANDRLFAMGEGTVTDQYETRARFDIAQAEALEAENGLDHALRQLGKVVGPELISSIDQLQPLRPTFAPLTLQPQALADWESLALSSNPQMLVQQQALEAAERTVQAQRAGHYPTVDLVASYGTSESDSVNTLNQRNRTGAVGVMVRLPLYSGGGVSAATTRAVALQERARTQLEGITAEAVVEVRRLYSVLQSGAARVRALASAAESAELAVQATAKSIQAGQRVNLDLLNADRQHYQARRELAQARYDYLAAYIQLRFIAGVLQIDDLEMVASAFLPARRQ